MAPMIPAASLDEDTAQRPEARNYQPKRPHTKSRTGCKACKARRVKCDEVRPSCRRCTNRKTPCVYSYPLPATKTSPPPGISGLLDFLAKEPLLPASSERDVVDMKLLWLFTSSVCGSQFAATGPRLKRINDILKVQIPQHAFECPFLMDCVLGISALQLQIMGRCDVEESRGVRYRARAFEGYRRAIADPEPGTSQAALVACSLFMTVLSSHVFRDEGPGIELYIVDWMVVWRGINVMVCTVSPRGLCKLGLADLFFRPEVDLNAGAFHVPEMLLAMVGSIQVGDNEYADEKTYYDTLKHLGSLYAGLSKDGLGTMMDLRITTWFTLIPGEFVELARQRRPRALVILAYYSVFLKMVRDLWWTTGIGDRGIRDILDYLAHEPWSGLLSLPRSALSLNRGPDIARLLLDDPEWQQPTPNAPDTPTMQSDCGESARGVSRWDTRGFQQDSIVLAASGIFQNSE